MNEIENIDYNIKQVETILEEVFSKFKNDDFEHLNPASFVYKNTIKFVPVELKKQVQSLLIWIEMMEQSKYEILSKRVR